MSTTENPPGIPPPAVDAPARIGETGMELKRGAFVNTIAMLASNFRGVFTFLVARLLGPAALGTYLVAWAAIELLSKIGLFGLDNAIVAFIARSEPLATALAATPYFASRFGWQSCKALSSGSPPLSFFDSSAIGLV